MYENEHVFLALHRWNLYGPGDRILIGSEVVTNPPFILRHFLTNSRGNLDCHIRLDDYKYFSPEQLEQEDLEFEKFLDEIFN